MIECFYLLSHTHCTKYALFDGVIMEIFPKVVSPRVKNTRVVGRGWNGMEGNDSLYIFYYFHRGGPTARRAPSCIKKPFFLVVSSEKAAFAIWSYTIVGSLKSC